MRDQIFISYCREDHHYKDRAKKHLCGLCNFSGIGVWCDEQIETGSQWDHDIAQAIQRAAAAVLLISKDYLASDYVTRAELPLCLEAWKRGELWIIPVIINPCVFQSIETLNRLQTANSPDKPVCELSELEQDKLWAGVAEKALKARNEMVRSRPCESAGIRSAAPPAGTPATASPAKRAAEQGGGLSACPAPQEADTGGYVVPDGAGWCEAIICEVRKGLSPKYRCYKIDGLIYVQGHTPKPGESHWIFYGAGEFHDLKQWDRVRFQVRRLKAAERWADIGWARNIYISRLFIDAKGRF